MGNVLCGDGRGVENWENRKNWKWFCLLWKKWWCYGEMDTTVGFSASNTSIYILKREANNSWRMCYGGGFENRENRKNRKRFCLLRKNRWCYDVTDTKVGLGASNKSIYILKREGNNSWRMCYGGGFENLENRKNRKRFCLLRKNRWCYDETDTTVGFSASNTSIYILKREANNSWRMCYGGGFENLENRKNRKRLCLLRKNRWCYDETDTTVGFSASNTSIYILKREANNSWRMCYWGGFENQENRKNRKRFCLLRKNRWCYYETDTTVGFSASNRSIYILTREANNSWRMCYGGLGGGFENWENRKNRKWFCLLRKNRWCYDETDTTVGFSASNRSIYILKRKANGSWGMCYERVQKLEKLGKSETFLLVEKDSVGLMGPSTC